MIPHQTCRRLFLNDIDMMENAATTDSCPLGFRCVTYGSPYIGHCCRLKCPYGEPDLTYLFLFYNKLLKNNFFHL